MSSTDHVTLKVYDILGNEIRTLVNDNQNIGASDVILQHQI